MNTKIEQSPVKSRQAVPLKPIVRGESVTKRLQKLKTKDHYSFEQWLEFLDQVFLTWRWKHKVTPGNAECWRDYYDDGYTALDAAYEDLGHAM